MSFRIFLACEDAVDARVARTLVDERVVRTIEWLRRDDLDPEAPAGHWKNDAHVSPLRTWAGRTSSEPFFDIHKWKEALDQLSIGGQRPRLHGFVGGKPGGGEAFMIHGCLLLAQHAASADAAVIVRDVDDEPARADALERLRADPKLTPRLPVVLASPMPEIEAWILVGFSPQNDEESVRLKTLRAQLSFDPTREPYRLSFRGKPAERDPKRIEAALVRPSGPDRWKECLLSVLDKEGDCFVACNLRRFLADIDSVLLPIIRRAVDKRH